MPSEAIRPKTILAHLVLAELRQEAALERALARFSQDDDAPRPPEIDPLSSAQARRAHRHD